jgi:ribonuclease Z
LLSTFTRWETIEELEICAGSWALERIYDLIYGVVLRGAESSIRLHLREIQTGLIYDEQDFTVSAFPVYHRGPDCFGFLFEEKNRRPFLPEMAEALDIPPGPWRRDLVNGKATTLPDGRLIEPDQVLGPERQGTRLVHVGDAGRTADLLEICRGVDTLVIEATYLEADADMARRFAHLTARQAAELALRAGVGHLIITHLSRRYRERDVIAEAQSIFPRTIVARDLDVFQVKRGELIQIEA